MPLFPLNSVLFPGAQLPLHVFEERYRAMVRDLLEADEPAGQVFGVVAIREGYEVGHEARSMHRVGCAARILDVERYDDGRFALRAVGTHRLRVEEVDSSTPYLTAEVTPFPAEPRSGEPELEAAARALATVREYREALHRLRNLDLELGRVPRDPELLSWHLAGTCLLTLPQRQALLEATASRQRLDLLRRGLREEMRAMRAVPSLPATEVARSAWSPN